MESRNAYELWEQTLQTKDIAENLGDTLDCQQPRELFLWSSQK